MSTMPPWAAAWPRRAASSPPRASAAWHWAGAGSRRCCKEALAPAFKTYQQQIVKNAARLAGALAQAGFRLVSGGTDNHLMLVDVFSRGLTGKIAEAALGRAGITVNKNAIPFDQHPPMTASGIPTRQSPRRRP